MYNHLENNWMDWHYDSDPAEKFRSHGQQQFGVTVTPTDRPVLDLKTECRLACESIRDTFPGEPLCVLFSGGSESEITVRSFLAAGIPIEVYIARYEDNINIYDVSHAVVICESLGVDYKIIDFAVQRFFRNDAAAYSTASQCVIPPLLVQMPLCELVDGIPIMGGGEIAVHRTTSDYAQQGTWLIEEWEYNWAWSRYFRLRQRPAVVDWCRWRPTQFMAWQQLRWFQQLITDQYPGKQGVDSTKLQGYREAWPDMITRTKRHGLEAIEPLMRELTRELIHVNGGQCYGGSRYLDGSQQAHPSITGSLAAHQQWFEVRDFQQRITGQWHS